MKISSIFEPLVRFLKGQENPWIAFFFWFLLGNILMMLLFYDLSKWMAFSLFEKYAEFPQSAHYSFVDTILTLFLLVTGAGTFICGLRAASSQGKIVCGLTVFGILFLLIFMGMTSDIPPEVQAEIERRWDDMQQHQHSVMMERQGSTYTQQPATPSADPFTNNQQRYREILQQQNMGQPQAPAPYDPAYPGQ